MDILTTVLSSASVSGLLIFLFKDWISDRLKGAIEHEYAQKLETHKAQLQAASDIEIEKLKSQLQTIAAERSIKLTEVFEKQAEIIAEAYSKLDVLLTAARAYTAPITFEGTPAIEERLSDVVKGHAAFVSYYSPKKLYFPKHTQTRIEAFILEMVQVIKAFQLYNDKDTPPEMRKEMRNTWTKTMDFFGKECNTIMDELDSDFKTILGLLDKDKPAN